jgi:hypothetical protein
MESVGACCKFAFLTDTRRIRARNIPTSARTGFLEGISDTVDVLGGAQGANYASEYRVVDGVMLATRRRVVAYDDSRRKVPVPVLISIDLSEIHFK